MSSKRNNTIPIIGEHFDEQQKRITVLIEKLQNMKKIWPELYTIAIKMGQTGDDTEMEEQNNADQLVIDEIYQLLFVLHQLIK